MSNGRQSGYLTTHVLDTSIGKPANNLVLELWKLDGTRDLLVKSKTNSDGRVDSPLLEGNSFVPGVYELIFHAGDYFKRNGIKLPTFPYLDHIALRFGINNQHEHYHIPLLLSPYGYTTYRGS